jgi:hypothetical protein
METDSYKYNNINEMSKELTTSFDELNKMLYIMLGVLCLIFLLWLVLVYYLINMNKKKDMENLKVKLLLKNGEPIMLSDLKIKN